MDSIVLTIHQQVINGLSVKVGVIAGWAASMIIVMSILT